MVTDAVRGARQDLGKELRARREAAGVTQQQLADLLGYSRARVAGAEKGESCALLFWQGCDKLLRTQGALVAGFEHVQEIKRTEAEQAAETARAERAQRVRNHFITQVGERSPGAPGPPPIPRQSIEPTPISLTLSHGVLPDYADSDYLQQVQQHVREIVALDNHFGAADLVRLSTRFFNALRNHLGAGSFDATIERDLHSAAGELAEVVGWLAYDAEQHDLVRRMNQESLYFTRLSGDRDIELLTLQNASMHAAAQGRPREALSLVRSVLEGPYKLSPRLRALFLTRKARALAQCGDPSSIKTFTKIRSLFLEGVDDQDPPWAWWIDERELAWHEAMTLRDIGESGEALAKFEQSVTATPSTELRSQYLHRAFLLQGQIDVEYWSEAEKTVREIIPLVAEVASTRTAVLLRRALAQLAVADGRVPSGLQEQVVILSAALDMA